MLTDADHPARHRPRVWLIRKTRQLDSRYRTAVLVDQGPPVISIDQDALQGLVLPQGDDVMHWLGIEMIEKGAVGETAVRTEQAHSLVAQTMQGIGQEGLHIVR